jgi:hypothetical protein
MKISGIFVAALLIAFTTFAHASEQYLDDEPLSTQTISPTAAPSVDIESAVSQTATIVMEPANQAAPAVNAAAIGVAINGGPADSKQTDAIIKGLGVAVFLIFLSMLPALSGKGVFFWDITDILVSSLLSILVAASFIALLVAYFDQSLASDMRVKIKTIAALCIVAAYLINFVKAKIYNSAIISLLIAFGRLFLPLLILFAVFLARWSGGGSVSYKQQDHERSEEYSARIRRQEHELSENKRKSAWWVTLITLASIWLYSKLIAQKEWKGFAGYFSKVN